MKSAWVRFLLLAVVGFGLGAALALFQAKGKVVEKSPKSVSQATTVAGVPIGGAFSLTDHHGQAVTEKSWPGKYKLVFFGFTHCPDICPATLQKISAVMAEYDAKGEKLVPLLITVDPARDAPDVLAAYVSKFNPYIVGLTGTQEQINKAVNAYKVYAAKGSDDGKHSTEGHDDHMDDMADMVDHSAYVYLMSLDDALLETFGADESAEGMIIKIKAHI